jgi:hypothetical protein
MSVFELGQGALMFCSLAHDLNDDQSTCDEYCASDTNSDTEI